MNKEPLKINLDWEVESQNLYNRDGNALKDYRLLVRSDNGALLNVCKKSYTPTLNATFKNTVREMQRVTGFELSGFVEASGGKRIFAYLKSEGQSMAGFDFDNYMVIANSHDYSSSFFVGTVHNMIRCENQWAKVLRGAMHTIPHTASSESRIEELILRFETYMEDLRKTKRELELWKEVDVDQTLREMLVERILDIELGNQECSPRTQKRIDALNFSLDREMADIGENALGLFQGVTYYTTHLLNQQQKIFGNMTGSSYELNRKAMDFCRFTVEGKIDSMDFNSN